MNKEQEIIELIRTLLEHLSVPVSSVSVEEDEKMHSHRIAVSTSDSAILIGERGVRLLALNHIVKRMSEKLAPGEELSFVVDVNDYQKKRIDDIRAKAKVLAERARYFKSSVEMDPMSSYERMIIHAEFTDAPDIVTESSGTGKDRHIIIRYTETKGVL